MVRPMPKVPSLRPFISPSSAAREMDSAAQWPCGTSENAVRAPAATGSAVKRHRQASAAASVRFHLIRKKIISLKAPPARARARRRGFDRPRSGPRSGRYRLFYQKPAPPSNLPVFCLLQSRMGFTFS